jgi:hypothetical protein
MMKVWLLENEQARWFEFEEPHDMPSDVTVTMLTETEQPAQRTWVELTKEEVDSWELPDSPTVFEFVQFIEDKIKDKNI